MRGNGWNGYGSSSGKKGKVAILDRLSLVEVRLEQTKMLGMEKV